MAVSVREAGTPNKTGTGAILLSIPVTTAAGDLMVAFCYHFASTLFDDTTGWTKYHSVASSNGSWAVFYRFWQSGDTDPTFTPTTGNDSLVGVIISFSGVDSGTPIDTAITAADFAAPASPYNVTISALTTSANGALAVFGWGSLDDNTWAYQSGGGVETVPGYDNVVGSDNSFGIATKAMATAGGTLDQVSQQTNKQADAGRSIKLALAPAAAPAARNRVLGIIVNA